VDGYRAQAASVHMRRNGSGILSSEQGENDEDQFHTTTWSGDFLWRSNRFYVSGGNQLVYHVFSYTKYDTPIVHGNGNMVWPGFRPQPNVGDNLQFNRPTMGYMTDYSGYIARAQLLLRTGEAKQDAAICYFNYNNDRWDFDAFYHSDALERVGYSYEFLDPSLLELPNAVFENGVLAPDGPGYKALLFQNQELLPLKTVEKLRELAIAGLPVVFAGKLPDRAAYFGEDDSRIRTIMAELRALPNVQFVTDCEDFPSALTALNVRPSLRPNGAALMYARRRTAELDCYFLYNQTKYFAREDMWSPLTNIDTEIVLEAGNPNRVPYLLNLWSGEIHPIGEFATEGNAVRLRLRLRGNDTAAIILAPAGWCDADAVGDEVPSEVLPLEDWRLTVISHEPGDKALAGADLTDTKLVVHDLGRIGKAIPWTQIRTPDFDGETVSGVGIYETSMVWDGQGRAVLDLGAVCDLYRLKVNGAEVSGANPVNPAQDLSAYLRTGANTIRVEVASNFFHAEQSRGYLSTNWVERKKFTAWDFGILGQPAVKVYH